MTRWRSAWLTGAERVLWVAGIAIGAWTLFVVAQGQYYAWMPVPEGPPSVERRLPGESASDTPASSRRRRGEDPRAARHLPWGAWNGRLGSPVISWITGE